MSLNPDLIRERCVEIDTSLSRLEEMGRLSRETFLPTKTPVMWPAIDY